MTTLEEIVLMIEKYMETFLFPPMVTWPKYEFVRRSYSRWAAEEIIDRILDSSIDQDPIDVIKQFSDEMDYCFEISEDKGSSFMFSTAKEIAEEIIFLVSKGETNESVRPFYEIRSECEKAQSRDFNGNRNFWNGCNNRFSCKSNAKSAYSHRARGDKFAR